MVPTPGERRALGFLVFVALSGATVRVWKARDPVPAPPGVAALDRQLARVDSAQRAPKRGRRPARAKPGTDSAAAPRTPVDLDRASAAELEALPGIGPALAARIAAHRDSVGSFGSMEAFCEVRGVGPALAGRLSPLVTFSGARRPVSGGCDKGSKSPRNPRTRRARESG